MIVWKKNSYRVTGAISSYSSPHLLGPTKTMTIHQVCGFAGRIEHPPAAILLENVVGFVGFDEFTNGKDVWMVFRIGDVSAKEVYKDVGTCWNHCSLGSYVGFYNLVNC